jgi:hypothetical protein
VSDELKQTAEALRLAQHAYGQRIGNKMSADIAARFGKPAPAPRDEPPPTLPHGASEHALAGLARHFGGPLPPSYHAFLSLHDGWPGLSGGLSLFGVSAFDGEEPALALRQFAAWEPDRAAGAFVIGGGGESVLYLERATRRPNGECDVVSYQCRLGETGRFPEILAYLRNSLNDFRELSTR